jgi:hypothetical protein
MSIYNNKIIYDLHQTPVSLAKEIINSINWNDNENVCDPFAGEMSFYENLPTNINKTYAEITKGIDFRDIDYTNIETIISNPPYDLGEDNRVRKNSFYKILEYFSLTPVKRIIFLCSQSCFNSITPKRLKQLHQNGLYIQKITICNCKKWYGRYYVLYMTRDVNMMVDYFINNFD